jgi:Domain of unknown function (DUF5069)
MKLPSPYEPLAGCIWLPRLIAKIRLIERGELPPEYEVRVCHPNGVDGQFLTFFGLDRDAMTAMADWSDEKITVWFTARPAGLPVNIEKWNQIAVNLGRSGFPMADRLPVALATTYKHLESRRLTTVFEILEADEYPAEPAK